MVKWYIISKDGKIREAKKGEIPDPIIDHSDISLEDGDLVMPSVLGLPLKGEVSKHGKKNERKRKKR